MYSEYEVIPPGPSNLGVRFHPEMPGGRQPAMTHGGCEVVHACVSPTLFRLSTPASTIGVLWARGVAWLSLWLWELAHVGNAAV